MTRALFARGYVSMVLGDATTAASVLDQAEAKARAGRDSPLLARILSVSAGINVMSGELEGARSQLREAKTLAQGFDDPGVDAMLALTEGFIALGDVGCRQQLAASTPSGHLVLGIEATSRHSATCCRRMDSRFCSRIDPTRLGLSCRKAWESSGALKTET